MQNLQILINSLPGVLVQGLIWGIMAIGLYITYRLLDFADLTVDGSFCTGGMVCATMLLSGHNVWLAMLGALLAGMLAGFVTGILHTKLKIPAILSGILTQLGLWSVNLAITDFKANVSLTNLLYGDTMIVAKNYMTQYPVNDGSSAFLPALLKYIVRNPIFVVVAFTAAIIALLYWFFGTELGSSIRATGANGNMARAQGISTDLCKVVGVTVSNGLVALSGALLCQYQGFAEINMGRGAIVIGLAAIIIGTVLLGKVFHNFGLKLVSVSIGAILYYLVIQVVITMLNINPNYLKLITALIVALFLAIPNLLGGRSKKLKEARHA